MAEITNLSYAVNAYLTTSQITSSNLRPAEKPSILSGETTYQDKVDISPASQSSTSQNMVRPTAPDEDGDDDNDTNTTNTAFSDTNISDKSYESELSKNEQMQLLDLKKRDIEVRQHEQAHLAAAGQYALGGASLSYQQGPDGRKYAVAGEVSIDISQASTPEATIQKMQVVRNAALAPLSPSSADRAIAAKATMMQTQARQEMQMASLKDDSDTNEVSSQGRTPFLLIEEDSESTTSLTDKGANNSQRASLLYLEQLHQV